MLYSRKSDKRSEMNKLIFILICVLVLSGCNNHSEQPKRIALAKVGDVTLYFDEVQGIWQPGINPQDSVAMLQNYINKWAKKELLVLKAKENLSQDIKAEIEKQVNDTRSNLVIYQYQRQMMLEKMDTAIADTEVESYYATNEKNFHLNSNIVKAVFIKVPLETPGIDKIRLWARSGEQKDIQQLETYCYQFAEKYDDFNEEWVTMDKLSVELPQDISNQDEFLKWNKWYETKDSVSVYMIAIRDFKPRYSLAPFEYVKEDIKSIILNNRRFEFLQSLETGIYNEALKESTFKIY
jgi:hypothetical protein